MLAEIDQYFANSEIHRQQKLSKRFCIETNDYTMRFFIHFNESNRNLNITNFFADYCFVFILNNCCCGH